MLILTVTTSKLLIPVTQLSPASGGCVASIWQKSSIYQQENAMLSAD